MCLGFGSPGRRDRLFRAAACRRAFLRMRDPRRIRLWFAQPASCDATQTTERFSCQKTFSTQPDCPFPFLHMRGGIDAAFRSMRASVMSGVPRNAWLAAVQDELRGWSWRSYGTQCQQELRRDRVIAKSVFQSNLGDEDVPFEDGSRLSRVIGFSVVTSRSRLIADIRQ